VIKKSSSRRNVFCAGGVHAGHEPAPRDTELSPSGPSILAREKNAAQRGNHLHQESSRRSNIADSPELGGSRTKPLAAFPRGLDLPSMKPTQALLRSNFRKLALTTKDVNKGYYKGTRTGRMGSHTKKGGYVIDWARVRTYVVPSLEDFKVCRSLVLVFA
jgi:hypothetical protein